MALAAQNALSSCKMNHSGQIKYRIELWAEGQMYCYTNLLCPIGLTGDDAFDWALQTTLENGGEGFEIKILTHNSLQNAVTLKNYFRT